MNTETTAVGQGTVSAFEMRTDGLNHLSVGDIWGTRGRGTFVVVATRAANWRGEDRDVYAHIEQWLTCRPATPEECARWERAVVAATARAGLRKQLGANSGWVFEGTTLSIEMARLDSYSDQWNPPAPITLTPDQVAIEQEYLAARAALRVE